MINKGGLMVRFLSIVSAGSVVACALSASLVHANGLKFAAGERTAVREYAKVLEAVVGAESEAAGVAAMRAGMKNVGIVGFAATAEALYAAAARGTDVQQIRQFISNNAERSAEEFAAMVDAEFGPAPGLWAGDAISIGADSSEVIAAINSLPAPDVEIAYTIAENQFDSSVADEVADAVEGLQRQNCTTQSCDVAADKFEFALKAASLAPPAYRDLAYTVAVGLGARGTYARQLDEGATLTADILTTAGITDPKTGESVGGVEALQSAGQSVTAVVDGQLAPMPIGQAHCTENGHQG